MLADYWDRCHSSAQSGEAGHFPRPSKGGVAQNFLVKSEILGLAEDCAIRKVIRDLLVSLHCWLCSGRLMKRQPGNQKEQVSYLLHTHHTETPTLYSSEKRALEQDGHINTDHKTIPLATSACSPVGYAHDRGPNTGLASSPQSFPLAQAAQ